MANSKTKTQKKLKPKLQILYTTWPDRDTALKASTQLIQEGLAGCVNLLSQMTSVYSWEGKLETADEVVLLVKTDSRRLKPCRARLRQLHPYQVPCLMAWDVSSCNPDYAQWLLGSK